MFKKLIQKGTIHRADYPRALVSDTLPEDIPIIISNDGFYKNVKRKPACVHPEAHRLIEIILRTKTSHTIPYRYNILKSSGGTRRLSLIHPSSQLGVVDLYRNYGELICYYSRQSPASIRSPQKVGSMFFVRDRFTNLNALKGPGQIDTVDIERSVSNPATYFSYHGYRRAYQFFNSSDYLRLEKRYSYMYLVDISRCFDSIYTHTLFWAINDMQMAKNNKQALTFSNQFDHLMQSMNYSETSGICVGAEVSRVFAELILTAVDRRVVASLTNSTTRHRNSFEFRRYVDDYYLFASTEKHAQALVGALRTALGEFTLHLNEAKTVELPRPFITKKSRLIRDAYLTLEDFFQRFITVERDSAGSYSIAKPIRKSDSLLRILLDSVKSACFDHDIGYEATSNYIISALNNRVVVLIADVERGSLYGKVPDEAVSNCLEAILLLLEAIYFFYNLIPTIPSSLRTSQAALLSFEFVQKYAPFKANYLAEQLTRWTFQLLRSMNSSSIHNDNDCIPLEALNVLLVLGEIGKQGFLARKAILEFHENIRTLDYFEIVTLLFCIKSDPELSLIRDELFSRSRTIILSSPGVHVDTQAAHLGLDILSCPYLKASDRAQLLVDIMKAQGQPASTLLEAVDAVQDIEQHPWFVDWRGISLRRSIRKKELSSVY